MTNKVRVPGEFITKINQMFMGQFGTIMEGPRSGQHVFMTDCRRLVFLDYGGSINLNSNTCFGNFRVTIHESLLLERK